MKKIFLIAIFAIAFTAYSFSASAYVNNQTATIYESIESFLGFSNSNDDAGDVQLQSESDYARDNGFPVGGDGTDPRRGVYNFGDGSSNGYSNSSDTSGRGSRGGNASASEASMTAHWNNGGKVADSEPVFVCFPEVVSSGEPALVFFACGDSSTSSSGNGFNTNGATIGATSIYPTQDTQLTFSCNAGTEAICDVSVYKTNLAIIATPTSVQRGGSVSISWRGEGVERCSVSSDSHAGFIRAGLRGDINTPPITVPTIFTLSCDTESGFSETRTAQVGVY